MLFGRFNSAQTETLALLSERVARLEAMQSVRETEHEERMQRLGLLIKRMTARFDRTTPTGETTFDARKRLHK